MLRQLAQYHAKDPNNLFMVRLAQVRGSVKGVKLWRFEANIHRLLLRFHRV